MAQNGGVPPSASLLAQPGFPAARAQQPPSALVQSDFVTLGHPRPGGVRKENVYTDTPLRTEKDDHKVSVHLPVPSQDRQIIQAQASNNITVGLTRNLSQNFGLLRSQLPVTKQPTVTSFKKEKLTDVPNDTSDSSEDSHAESIICHECRRCKCESCRKPRSLPSKWICKDKYLCSADSIVDCCSCMCCVKGVFYHCAKDYELDNDVPCADEPCSCHPQQRCERWASLGVLSALLPCLLCYWPLKGCVKICEMGYSRLSSPGCRCVPRRTIRSLSTEKAPEKGLLDTNSDC
ncbi:uncharacterized protein LOC143253124 [Tachypleus tridentatus]|uniref:uncharacterized protein LOC143253124 n=1 Tax=Tachypleus tridentatus TaxID=6853 RepID=UPI003FD2BD54